MNLASGITCRIVFILLFSLVQISFLSAQLGVKTSTNADSLVQHVLLGNRVQISDIHYKGAKQAIGTFYDSTDYPLIREGLILSTGFIEDAPGPNKRTGSGRGMYSGGYSYLEKIAKGQTFDAAVLEFDFVADMELIWFNFIFASEEYTEYVGSQFNDVFAFWIYGPGYDTWTNIAVIPGKNIPITVNSVNHLYNHENYIENDYSWDNRYKTENRYKADPDLVKTFEFDGMTTLIRAEAQVKPGFEYSFRIAIADVSDSYFDSAVLLESGSFSSYPDDEVLREKLVKADDEGRIRKYMPSSVGIKPVKIPIDTQLKVGNGSEKKEVEKDSISAQTEPQKSEKIIFNNPVFPKTFVVEFEFDSDLLDSENKLTLDSAWAYYSWPGERKLSLTGHTDSIGNTEYNRRLSVRRAKSVKKYLVSLGCPEQRLLTSGLGFEKPVADNGTEKGRARNRRVEIVVE